MNPPLRIHTLPSFTVRTMQYTGETRPPLDRSVPSDLHTALFALGCFWGPDARFGAVAGVVRTCVGYAGGRTEAPTYENIGDHIETVRVEYDPSRVTYADLLLLFWASHDPTRPPFKRQYQPALFPETTAQADQAHASVAARHEEEGTSLTTEVIEDASFYRAEAYHQKHKLRRHPVLLDALQQLYPDEAALTDAPSAALLNGYVGGHRAPRHLDADLQQLGLSPEAARRLRTLVARCHSSSQPDDGSTSPSSPPSQS